MSDDIKSMIKSRRDERYFGSAFEKRDRRIDEARGKAAVYRGGMNIGNDKILQRFATKDDLAATSAIHDYEINNNRDINSALQERSAETGEEDSPYEGDLAPPEAVGTGNEGEPDVEVYYPWGEESRKRNVGTPRKQRPLNMIDQDAAQYARNQSADSGLVSNVAHNALDRVKGSWGLSELNPDSPDYQKLRRIGYSDGDIVKFLHMLDRLAEIKGEKAYDAEVNSDRIGALIPPEQSKVGRE